MKHFRPVTFVAVAALAVAAVLSGMAWTQDASTSQVDPAVQQAARLEVELAGYKDTSPEAADLLA